MATFTGVPMTDPQPAIGTATPGGAGPFSADLNGSLRADYGTASVAVRHEISVSDNPANVAEPGKGHRLELRVAPAECNEQLLQGPYPLILVQNLKFGTRGHLLFTSGTIMPGWTFFLLNGYRAVDVATVVGRVFDARTGNVLPLTRILFDGAPDYGGSQANDDGTYVAYLKPGVEYTPSGFNPDLCAVYVLDHLDLETEGRVDIYFLIPDECLFEDDGGIELPGEKLEDVLNVEMGFHDYEPLKTANVIKPGTEFRNEGDNAALPVGEEATLCDVTLTTPLMLDSVPVGGDTDGEYRMTFTTASEVPACPTVRLNGNEPNGNLLPGGTLVIGSGTRVRVYGKNVGEVEGKHHATLIGRSYG